ncbi:DUF6531 domain-containing protein [Polyangium aurulentum]|uniref:DUF6531 domain-containing protein n=1 Tax=Polyangium aurulentum TaxID=2567896 RepID=UPI003B830F32
MPTSPVPDAAAPPGMCPGVVVLGGGGDGGGGDGGGRGGKDGASGDGNGNGDGANGDEKNGTACGGGAGTDGGGCPNHHGSSASGTGSAGDPVDVVTGRVFTVPVVDLELPGPLPLQFERTYSSTACDRDVGLGFGFTHSLAWEVVERRNRILLHTHDGLTLDFGAIAPGEGEIGAHGWILHREGPGFALDLVDGRRLSFLEVSPLPGGKRYRLTQVVDRHQNKTTLVYREGVLSEIVDCVGRVVRVSATREGRIGGLALKNARQGGAWTAIVRYFYDGAGRLITVEDADGARTSFSYDDDNRLLSQTRPSGLTFFYRYDRRGRCVETWGEHPGGDDPSLAPDVPVRLADGETRAKGVHHAKLVFGEGGYSEVSTSITTLRYFGNAHGKLDKAVAAGAVFTRRFDDRGFLLEFTDACGATTTWERDLRGRETKIVDGLGGTTLIEREPDGHIRRIVDPGGGITEIERTPHALFWRDPIGATFEARHDRRGLIAQTVAPNGDLTRYRYDDHANLVEVVDAHGRVSQATYDAWGRCTSTTDASGATTRYTYSNGERCCPSLRLMEIPFTTSTIRAAGSRPSPTRAAGRRKRMAGSIGSARSSRQTASASRSATIARGGSRPSRMRAGRCTASCGAWTGSWSRSAPSTAGRFASGTTPWGVGSRRRTARARWSRSSGTCSAGCRRAPAVRAKSASSTMRGAT